MTGARPSKGTPSLRYGFTMIPEIDSEGAWNSQVIDAIPGDTGRQLSAADRGGEPCRASR
jgi:hypothetical protein